MSIVNNKCLRYISYMFLLWVCYLLYEDQMVSDFLYMYLVAEPLNNEFEVVSIILSLHISSRFF